MLSRKCSETVNSCYLHGILIYFPSSFMFYPGTPVFVKKCVFFPIDSQSPMTRMDRTGRLAQYHSGHDPWVSEKTGPCHVHHFQWLENEGKLYMVIHWKRYGGSLFSDTSYIPKQFQDLKTMI